MFKICPLNNSIITPIILTTKDSPIKKTKMKKNLLLLALIACFKMSFSQIVYDGTGSILIDAGSNNPTLATEWNNMTVPTAVASTAAQTLVNSAGQTTPFKAYVHDSFVTGGFSGLNTAAHGYPATALIDFFYGSIFDLTGGITLTNLDLNKLYSFKFIALRVGVTDNRETKYTVSGKTSEVVNYNASLASQSSTPNQPVSTLYMEPNASGEITIDVTFGGNNNNADKFFYLGVIDVSYNPNTTLPVTMSYFNGEKKNEGISLKWQTLSESNSSHFEVLRSADANNFTSIGSVSGKGNSNIVTNYTFTDFNPSNGTNYYQLKQVDLDGKFSLSKLISLNAGLNSKVFESNYIDGIINLYFNNENKEDITSIVLYDITGRKIGTYKKNLTAGLNKLSISNFLMDGVYMVNLSVGNSLYRTKLIVNN